MTDIIISREDSPAGGRYVAKVNGHIAEMTYSRVGTTRIIIDHTGVPKALAGLGVGKALVRQAVEDARKDRVRIVPACSFVKVMIDRNRDWQDVLD